MMPALSKAVSDHSSKAAVFKQMDSERLWNGMVTKGKQVTRPVRFFVSEPCLGSVKLNVDQDIPHTAPDT